MRRLHRQPQVPEEPRGCPEFAAFPIDRPPTRGTFGPLSRSSGPVRRARRPYVVPAASASERWGRTAGPRPGAGERQAWARRQQPSCSHVTSSWSWRGVRPRSRASNRLDRPCRERLQGTCQAARRRNTRKRAAERASCRRASRCAAARRATLRRRVRGRRRVPAGLQGRVLFVGSRPELRGGWRGDSRVSALAARSAAGRLSGTARGPRSSCRNPAPELRCQRGLARDSRVSGAGGRGRRGWPSRPDATPGLRRSPNTRTTRPTTRDPRR